MIKRQTMTVAFTAHNIRLDCGARTKPDAGPIEKEPVFLAARRALDIALTGDPSGYRIADLGCLEGGYSVEFARLGFQVLGLEVRSENFAACQHVKAGTDLPNLSFVQDDCWNIDKYGEFDAIFCCGLFYHLDRPREFLTLLSKVTKRLLILQTHYSAAVPLGLDRVPRRLLRFLPASVRTDLPAIERYRLGPMTTHEGLPGRWFTEFADAEDHKKREGRKWSSWDNVRSFWVQREYLAQAMQDAGFGVVAEQLDACGPDIAAALTEGYNRRNWRGTFLGVKMPQGLSVSIHFSDEK
jgi:SAM-dependent methyltransferase